MLKKNEIFINKAKQKLKKNKKISGAWLQTGSNITAEILAKCGFDILAVDLEHGAGNIVTLIQQLQAMEKYDVTGIVRISHNNHIEIKKVLDAGARGIIVPCVNSKIEAENIVKACKYPLAGIRGVAPSPRGPGFGLDGLNYLNYANDEILIFAQIESVEGVANISEILDVKGIDGIFIGPMDLASSMGYFCNPTDPKVQETIRKLEILTLEKGKFLATVANDYKRAETLYNRGYSFILMMSDSTTLAKVGLSMVNDFNKSFNV